MKRKITVKLFCSACKKVKEFTAIQKVPGIKDSYLGRDNKDHKFKFSAIPKIPQ